MTAWLSAGHSARDLPTIKRPPSGDSGPGEAAVCFDKRRSPCTVSAFFHDPFTTFWGRPAAKVRMLSPTSFKSRARVSRGIQAMWGVTTALGWR